jgi:hypothetical protein
MIVGIIKLNPEKTTRKTGVIFKVLEKGSPSFFLQTIGQYS